MRSDIKISTSPPPPPPPPELGEAAAERPKEKRPWNKPRIKVIDVAFDTLSGNSTNPAHSLEGPGESIGGPNATYRVS